MKTKAQPKKYFEVGDVFQETKSSSEELVLKHVLEDQEFSMSGHGLTLFLTKMHAERFCENDVWYYRITEGKPGDCHEYQNMETISLEMSRTVSETRIEAIQAFLSSNPKATIGDVINHINHQGTKRWIYRLIKWNRITIDWFPKLSLDTVIHWNTTGVHYG